jgi:hypothetical protein
LPIRAKRQNETAAHWECANCSTPLTGVLLTEAAVKASDSIRIGKSHFDTAGVPNIPPKLRQLVREFVDSRRNASPADDRRSHPRVPRELDVTVLLLDEHWSPRAKPLLGMAVDITPHGLGMVTTSAIDSKFAAVQIRMPDGVAQILGQVVWTKDIGHGFFNTGLQFILRFGRHAAGAEHAAN